MKKPRRKVPVKKPQKQSKVTAKAPMGPKQRQHSVSASGGMTSRHRRSVTGKGTLKPVGKVTGTGKMTRKWSPGWDVACCSHEALGTLLGWDHNSVLELYWRTCSDPDEGASIPDTLRASPVVVLDRTARPGGLGFLGSAERFALAVPLRLVPQPSQFLAVPAPERPVLPAPGRPVPLGVVASAHGLILGVSLPEPHAVAVTPDGQWHSWGEPFRPHEWPDLVIDEAWAVLL